MAASSELRLWKRSKYSCSVRLSRKTERQDVGICTVERSSADSSVDVPMKSKERQAQESFSSQLMRELCRGSGHCTPHNTSKYTAHDKTSGGVHTWVSSLTLICLSSVQERVKMSKRDSSLKELATLRCLASDLMDSAWFISSTSWCRICTPTTQWSTDP